MKTTLKKFFTSLKVAAAGGAAVLGIITYGFGWPQSLNAAPKTTPTVEIDSAPLSRETKSATSFAPVVKKVIPSVVNVFTTKTVKNPYTSQMMPFFNDPSLRRFFGDQFDENDNPQRQPHKFKEQSLGSGVIVTKDGYILTNNHMVDGADEINVSMAENKKKLPAKIVGRDPRTDIAVLKIDGKDLPFVTFTDSDKVEVGDVVLALGSPFGLGQTVTMGIVSAVGRGDLGIEAYEDFIQTDAAINRGNSGGALVDAEGRLIGINTAILSGTGGNQGVGFAIPANMARGVMDQLIKNGRVQRGFLGVLPQDVTPDLAREFNVPESGGALIGEVTKNGAADEAGLKYGDVIVELDGKPVKDSRNFRLMVGKAAPGTKVQIKVLRDGKEKTFKATLKEMPEPKLSDRNIDSDKESSDALDGVEVGDIDAAARKRFKLPADLQGAVITNIDPDSASFEAGLHVGDVIQEINRKPVTNAEEAVEESKSVKSKRVAVRVWSRGGSHYVVVDETKGK